MAAAEGERSQAEALLAKTGFKGGLAVCLGSSEVALSETLGRSPGSLIQVLDRSDAKVADARERLLKAGLYGKVTANAWTGDRLPYADNLVRLIVVEQADFVAREEMMRVLCPGGVLALRGRDGWTVTIKPRPGDIDDWTHFLHGPDNNAVADDMQVGPPRQLQWRGALVWSRDHSYTPSLTSLVSDEGRLFAIMDYGPTVSRALPNDWRLVAFDAFSGIELWRVAMGKKWSTQGFRGGPPVFARRLVATGGRVYVTLEDGAPVSALDAATGNVVQTFAGTEETGEVLVDGDRMVLRREGSLAALDLRTGRIAWEKQVPVAAMSLTLAEETCYAIDTKSSQLAAWDVRSGEERWRRPSPPSAVVVASSGVVLVGAESGGKVPRKAKTPLELLAVDAKTGKDLWKAPFGTGFATSSDILVVNGAIWASEENQVQGPHTGIQFTQGRDLKTGAVRKTQDTRSVFDLKLGVPHHRCYRNKATRNYLIAGRDGTDFIDLATGAIQVHRWTRGTCRYGIMPANGLLYVPPHACSCYPAAKLHGFLAFTAAPVGAPAADGERLWKGPAYRAGKMPTAGSASASDWPTFRGDAERSGRSRGAVPTNLEPIWRAELGGELTQPVCADGRLLVSRKDTCQIICLDAGTGKESWRFTAGAAVDSPPTCFAGGVLFGCRDGRVYRLRAEDGALEWIFLAAPHQRWICSYGRPESAWPLHGGVLVVDGKAMVVAGHNSFVGGGLHCYRLDAVTGEVLLRKTILDQDPLRPFQGNSWDLEGSLNDILSSDGESWFLRQRQFTWDATPADRSDPHLFSASGFLDPSMHHRHYWVYAARYGAGVGAVYVTSRVPYGRILSLDERNIFGFRTVVHGFGRGNTQGAKERVLCAYPRVAAPKREAPKAAWAVPLPFSPNAMALAANALLVAGPMGDIEESIEAFRGEEGSALWAVSPDTGAKLAERQLEHPPVFDGLIAANGKVFLADVRGRVTCWQGKP
jgi:outer membrane protein assembly factor BamB